MGLFTQSEGVSQLHGTMFEFDLDEENPTILPDSKRTSRRAKVEEEMKEDYVHILSGLFSTGS